MCCFFFPAHKVDECLKQEDKTFPFIVQKNLNIRFVLHFDVGRFFLITFKLQLFMIICKSASSPWGSNFALVTGHTTINTLNYSSLALSRHTHYSSLSEMQECFKPLPAGTFHKPMKSKFSSLIPYLSVGCCLQQTSRLSNILLVG